MSPPTFCLSRDVYWVSAQKHLFRIWKLQLGAKQLCSGRICYLVKESIACSRTCCFTYGILLLEEFVGKGRSYISSCGTSRKTGRKVIATYYTLPQWNVQGITQLVLACSETCTSAANAEILSHPQIPSHEGFRHHKLRTAALPASVSQGLSKRSSQPNTVLTTTALSQYRILNWNN